MDDLADASIFLLNLPEDVFSSLLTDHSSQALINVGSGEEISIKELALAIKGVVGFAGDLAFDASKPDGTPRKLSDVSRLHGLGWKHEVRLIEGLRETYQWYLVK